MRVRKFLLIDLQIANFVSEPVRNLQIRKFSTIRQRELNIFLKIPSLYSKTKLSGGLFGKIFYLIKILIRTFQVCIFKQNLQICRSFKPATNLGQQITNLKIAKNIGSEICKSANCHTYVRSANVTKFCFPQICGFPLAWGKMIHEKNLKAKNLVTLSLLSKTLVHTRIQ